MTITVRTAACSIGQAPPFAPIVPPPPRAGMPPSGPGASAVSRSALAQGPGGSAGRTAPPPPSSRRRPGPGRTPAVLSRIQEEFSIPVLTLGHAPWQCYGAASAVGVSIFLSGAPAPNKTPSEGPNRGPSDQMTQPITLLCQIGALAKNAANA
ncbi:hypothetical protein SDC9_50971 [bioreactor metagenome]|uniref:Uncharacterized protein n=1 Tax=bioreactor metagenome TaxID=1076179 RepID=A0A644WLN6_9ZZZZ